jgi:hypothetical protein
MIQPAVVRTRLRGRLEDRLQVLVVELRNDRCDEHADRYARFVQRAHRLQAALGRRRARLQHAREIAVERRDREIHARHVLGGHGRDEVDVALDERRLGHDRERMLVRRENLEDAARDLPFALDRLIRVGVAAERDRVALVAGLASSARSSTAASGLAKSFVSNSRPGDRSR